MSKTMKLAVVSPNPCDGTAWYRSSLPFIRMQQKYDDFQFQEFGLSSIDWEILMNFDVLFLQRPCGPEQVRLANKAAFLGLKVWIDYDDMLWDLHPSSPVYPMYSSPEIQDSINRIMSVPGITITVSTMELLHQLQEKWPQSENVYLISNAVENKNGVYSAFLKDRVLWRGSETHVSDLDIFRGYYDHVMLDYPKLTFDFFGYNPWYWTSRISNAKHIPGVPLLDYYAKISQANWKVWVCMLEDTPFNRCKSNILFLEATMAGAVVVAPAWFEWIKPGVINYRNIVDFKDAMNFALNLPEDEHNKYLLMAHEYIVKNQLLSDKNEIRYSILKNLTAT
jgi:hypothetical protein